MLNSLEDTGGNGTNYVPRTPDKNFNNADHEKALELRKRLSNKLDETALRRIDKIVNNVVFGPYKSDRTEVDIDETSGLIRSKAESVLEGNQLTEDQTVNEVVKQVKSIGITGSEVQDFLSLLTEFTRLMYRSVNQ